MLLTPPAAAARGGIRYGHLLSKVVNRPLLTIPLRALTLLGLLAPRAGVRADDIVAGVEAAEGQGPLLLSRLVASASAAPRIQGSKDEGKAYRVQSGVAIIPVTGDLVHDLGTLDPVCGMTGYDGIAAKLDLAESDPAVRGVLLVVDSPGGEVTGCATCGDRIRDFLACKPLRTAFADTGYSAACWLGAQGERVYAPRTGGTGSIGVITLHADLSQAYSEAGMVITVLTAGAHKADGHPFGALPEAVAASITAELEGLRGHFAAAVALGRGIAVEDVLATEARCLSAAEALDLGLIDEILSPDDALAQFIADLDGGSTGVTAAPSAHASRKITSSKRGEPAMGPSASRKRVSDAPPPPPEDEEDDDAPAAGGEEGEEDEDPAAEGEEDEQEASEADEPEDKTPEGKAASRIKSILHAPEAKGRRKLAEHLAFSTRMSAKEARKLLAAAPKAAPAAGKPRGNASAGHFEQLMAGQFAGPALGGGGGGDGRGGVPGAALAAAMDRTLAAANLGKKGP